MTKRKSGRTPAVALATVAAILGLMPAPVLAQFRGAPGGFGGQGGGFGGGIGAGIGGAILGGVIGSMARERAQRLEEPAESLPSRRPGRLAETPPRQRPVPMRRGRHRQSVGAPALVKASPRPPAPGPLAPRLTAPRRSLAKAPPPRAPGRVTPALPAAATAAIAEEPGTVPGEVLIALKAGAPGGTLARLARRERLEAIESDSFTLVPLTLHRYRIRGPRSVAAVVRALEADPAVASAQANHAYALVGEAAPALPLAGAQYVVAKLHLDEAHRAATGRGVSVAVIDSGIDDSHPTLAGALAENWDAIGKAALPAGAADPHGTAVAGIVGARTQLASASPGARLVALRAFSGRSGDRPGAQGTTIHVLRAVDRAAALGTRVVNMSFAGPADAKLSQFLAAGTARGIVYVAAAGNAGPSAAPLHPAADPNVLAVTATDAEDRLFPGANRGAHLCVSAPGVEVFVAAPGGAYGFLTGTSMAAPQVAGIAAMMLEARPELTPAALRAALAASARDLGPAGPDPGYGAGSADAREALKAVGVSFDPPVSGEAKPVEAETVPVGMAVPVPVPDEARQARDGDGLAPGAKIGVGD